MKPTRAGLHHKIVEIERSDTEKDTVKGGRGETEEEEEEGRRRRRERDRRPESWALKTPKALCCQCYIYTRPLPCGCRDS